MRETFLSRNSQLFGVRTAIETPPPLRTSRKRHFTQFGRSSAPTPAPAGGRLFAAPVGAAPYSRGAPRCGGAGLRVAFRRGRLAAPVGGHTRQKVPARLVAAHTKALHPAHAAKLFRVSPAAHCVLFGALSRVTINGSRRP